MHFYTSSPNKTGTRIQRNNTLPDSGNFDAYLLEQATQFVQQNTLNVQPQQLNTQHSPIRYQKIQQNLNIQPFRSDQSHITPNRQINRQQIINNYIDDLDLYLTKQAEDLVERSLKPNSEGSNIQYVFPSAMYEPALFQQNLIEYQTPQLRPQPNQQLQYYIPPPQVQPREVIRQFTPQEQIQQVQTPLPQFQPNQLLLPSPDIRQEQINRGPIIQDGAAVTNVEATIEKKMEFMKKGPRGEALYKVAEGGVNYYIKRGLTPEAVSNYALAHIIGVGPPVEIIESDGIKMEEGVCLRQAVKDKLITMEEVRAQIQGLHKILFDTGMAHCDVKFENCLYFPKYGKVLLIDNGDLSVYGNKRTIKTAGANSTMLIHGNEERNRVGPATDLRGFLHVIKNALHGHS